MIVCPVIGHNGEVVLWIGGQPEERLTSWEAGRLVRVRAAVLEEESTEGPVFLDHKTNSFLEQFE